MGSDMLFLHKWYRFPTNIHNESQRPFSNYIHLFALPPLKDCTHILSILSSKHDTLLWTVVILLWQVIIKGYEGHYRLYQAISELVRFQAHNLAW